MEGIIFFIIIIVVLNLLGRLMGSGKKRQTPSRHRSQMPGETKVEKTGETMAHYRPGRSFDQYSGFVDETEEDEEEETDKKLAEDFPEGPVRRREKQPSGGSSGREKKKSGSTGVSLNLRNIIADKDSLVTAFIFHELLEPPRALRKKRKKSM